MRVEVITDLQVLQAHAPAWQALYDRVPQASVFESPTWVLNWLRSFAVPGSLVCLVVRDGDAWHAVLPLVKVDTRWRRVPVRALCPCTNAHSVRSAFLYAPDFASQAWDLLLRTLHARADWDLLLLDGSPVRQPEIPMQRGETERQVWQHSALTVQGSWDSFLSSKSRDLRRNLRRTNEGLAAQGSVAFHVETQDVDQLLHQWIAIDRHSWKARSGETVDSSPQTLAYYRGLLQGLADSGMLLGGVLTLNDAPIAAVVCATSKGTCYTLKTAMRDDLASAHVSPGLLVMERLLQHVWHGKGFHTIDFVCLKPYTQRWSAEVLQFERRALFASTWRGILAGALERSSHRLLRPAAVALSS